MGNAVAYLRAVDVDSVQAIYEQAGEWFRVSFDDDWRPVLLANGRDIVRCFLASTYETRNIAFRDVESLIDAVSEECEESLNVPDVPLSDVIHHFSKDIQNAWETEQQVRRAENNRLNEQAHSFLEVKPKAPTNLRPYPPVALYVNFDALENLDLKIIDKSVWIACHDTVKRIAPTVFHRISAFDFEDIIVTSTYRLAQHVEILRGKSRYDVEALPLMANFVIRRTIKKNLEYKNERDAHFPPLSAAPAKALTSKDVGPEYALIKAEQQKIVEKAIMQLSPRDSTIVKTILEWSYSDRPRAPRSAANALSQELGVPYSFIMRRYTQALYQLRRLLEADGIHDEDG